MNNLEKSLIALDNLLNTISKDEMDKIVAEIDGMSATGPTVFEYLEEFESQFVNLQNSQDCWATIDIPNLESLHSNLESLHYDQPQDIKEGIIDFSFSKKIHFDYNINIGQGSIDLTPELPIAA